MSFYYVKAGGSASGATEDNDDGIYSTAKTGTWASAFSGASEYFDTITVALASAHTVVSGDSICISDSSVDTLTSSVTDVIPEGVEVITVSDSNVDQYAIAASSQITSSAATGYAIHCEAESSLAQISGLYVLNNISREWSISGSKTRYLDCTFEMGPGATRWFFLYYPAAHYEYINCTFTGDVSLYMQECSVVALGCVFDSEHPMPLRIANTSQSLTLDGCDLSQNTSTNIYEAPASTTTALTSSHYIHSKLPLNWTVANAANTITSPVIIESCDSAYQYVEEGFAGNIEFVTDIYYNSHDTLSDGLTKGSWEFESNTSTSKVVWLQFSSYLRHPTRGMSAINTEAATRTKVRIRFVTLSGQSLDTSDLVFLVGYPGDAAYRRDWVTHVPNDLAAGSALPTETTSAVWTGAGLATSSYYFDVDMGSPLNGRVVVIPGVTKASVTVYFSWQLEFVA